MVEMVGEDASTRRYVRVSKGNRSAIFMEVYAETPGHRLMDFIRIGTWMREIGLHTPEIYEADEQAGHLLLEDFGDISLKTATQNGTSPSNLYKQATEILDFLNKQDCPLDLPHYHESLIHHGHCKIIDWYIPTVRGDKNPDNLIETYLSVWSEIENALPPCPNSFLHIDFHAENLMWLSPGIGILDFQGAMIGPAPYDWGNLLEDPRHEISNDLRQNLLSDKDDLFLAWYRILTTQFHCRVIGQYIKLAYTQNKPRYLNFVPLTEKYIASALKDPLLSPLKRFFSEIDLDFTRQNDLNSLDLSCIREDAA